MNSSNSPDLGSRLHLLSNFSVVADQASKLGVGRTMAITSQYNDYQVVITLYVVDARIMNITRVILIRFDQTVYLFVLQVIQIYSLPLVITFVADADANTGYIQSLENQLAPLLNDLKEIVLDRHDVK